MRFVFAIKSLASPGGAERVLCILCSELAARGHDITVVTFDADLKETFYEIDSRVRLVRLGIGVTTRPAKVIETFSRMKGLRNLVLACSPDVAIGFMHSAFIPLVFALIGTRIPVLGSEHIVHEYYRDKPLQYFLFLVASIKLRSVTVLSESIRRRYALPIRKCMVPIPNPVMLPSRKVNSTRNRDKLILLNVGRMEEQKDQLTLLYAFSYIHKSHPNWDLRIVGEGALRPKLENLICALGIEGRVHMPGVVSKIGEEYLSADAFVISSRYEAFGLVTAEAMSHGLPVIGFLDCPGTNELIESERTGLLVAPRDDRAMALARELSRLFADEALRRRLGESGRLAIDCRFSPGNVCDLWERLLFSVCSKVC